MVVICFCNSINVYTRFTGLPPGVHSIESKVKNSIFIFSLNHIITHPQRQIHSLDQIATSANDKLIYS